MTGSTTAEHAWVRAQLAGRPRVTADNAGDFTLVSTTGGAVGGVPAALGSASPPDPRTHSSTTRRCTPTLLDPLAGAAADPNRVRTGTTLTVRRTITNTSGTAPTGVQARLTALSQTSGRAYPGTTPPAKPADLKLAAPATPTNTITVNGAPRTVANLSPDPPTGPAAGGLNSTLTVPLPEGGLAAGASIDVALTFTVITGGTFWFGYDMEALR